VFDDALPFALKLVQDRDGFGGEVGHVPVTIPTTDGDPDARRLLGRAAAAGDLAARSTLAAMDLSWCECGNIDDLCSHASGPGTLRMVGRRAARYPVQWHASALSTSSAGDPAQVTSAAIAQAARAGDPFTNEVLREATRPLALYLLQLSAQLGLRRFVVMGGFAQGVGGPWFAALREGLGRLLPDGAWFTGWTEADLDALVRPSVDVDDSLAGMGCFLEAREGRFRALHKPIGRGQTTVRNRQRPDCGREQFQAAIAFAGICGTDLQILRGERGCEPDVLGHECVAEVIETGPGVVGLEVGTVFAVNPNHPTDEHDKLGHNQPGVLRELATWDGHLIGRGQVVELPAKSSAALVLLEPLACTARSLGQAGPDWSGRTVLVVGAGVSGLLHVLLARHWGARRVLLANRGAERLVEAVRRGLIPAEDGLGLTADIGRNLLTATDGRGVDAAVLAVSGMSGPAILDQIWPGLGDGATVHLSGGFPPETVLRLPDGESRPSAPIRARQTRPPVRLADGRTVTLTGSRGADRADFEAARRACLPEFGGGLDLAPLVSHLVSLEATPRVMTELAATGRVEGELALRVVVDLREPGDMVRRAEAADLPVLGVPG
jgi:threonine dehydrogenase-like Zn-dependent dehydrogenase